MSEYRWFTDHYSVYQNRTSYRCLVRKSVNSGLQIKFKRWGQQLLFLSPVERMDIGIGLSWLLGVSRCLASTLTTTTMTTTILALPACGNIVINFFNLSKKLRLKNGLDPTSDHLPYFLNNCLDCKILYFINNASVLS